MACIPISKLEDVIKEDNILLEIKLAAVQHYFETARNVNEVRYSNIQITFKL